MAFNNLEYSVLKRLAYDMKKIKRNNTVSFIFSSDEQVAKARILT